MESLLEIGFPISFVLVLVQMYSYTRVLVRVGRQVSRVVRGYKDVKQGCTLSPKLFTLFINSVVALMETKTVLMVSLDFNFRMLGKFRMLSYIVSICMMLFPDDIVLVADSQRNLQKLLDILGDNLDRKKIELKVDKELLFRKCGRIE